MKVVLLVNGYSSDGERGDENDKMDKKIGVNKSQLGFCAGTIFGDSSG